VTVRSVSPVDSSSPFREGSRLKPSGLPLRSSIPILGHTTTPSLASVNSNSSKENSPSPSASCRNSLAGIGEGSRIPISKSQDDLLRNVHLRQTNKQTTASKQRPTSYRNSITSPRNSKLMSRNSVEVLSYNESQKNSASISSRSESSSGKFYGQYANQKQNKHETTSKFTKKFGSKDSSLNAPYKNSRIQKPNVIAGEKKVTSKANSQIPSSHIPAPVTKRTQPTTPLSKQTQSHPTGQNKLSVDCKKNGVSCNKSSNLITQNKEKVSVQTKRLSNESLKLDELVKTVNSKNNAGKGRPPMECRLAPMISESNKPTTRPPESDRSPSKKVYMKNEAEKVLTEQLLKGKIPPKAKFRADDEISIGDTDGGSSQDLREQYLTQKDKRSFVSKQSPCKNISANSSSPKAAKMADRILPTPLKTERIERGKAGRVLPEPGSHANILISKSLEETKARDQKTNSLPLNAVLSYEHSDAALAKSTSLDKYYKTEKPQTVKPSSSDNFFQRLTNLRRSFNTADHKRSVNKIKPHLTQSNTPFFQGITDVKRPTSRPSKIIHGPHLVISPIIKSYKPPIRKYHLQRLSPKVSENGGLKRSFSFSDAQIIAQAVADGDSKVITELYPGFPFSESIYTVIDRAKNTKSEKKVIEDPTSNKSIFRKSDEMGKDNNVNELQLSKSMNNDDKVNLEQDDPRTEEVTFTVSTLDNVTGRGMGQDHSKGEEDLGGAGQEQQGRPHHEAGVTSIEVNPSPMSRNHGTASPSSQSSPAFCIDNRSSNSGPGGTKSLHELATPSTPKLNFYNPQDLSPIISPWGAGGKDRSTSDSPIRSSADNVVLVECKNTSLGTTSQLSNASCIRSQPHPFIYRVQNQLNFTAGSENAGTAVAQPKFNIAKEDNVVRDSVRDSVTEDGENGDEQSRESSYIDKLQHPFRKILAAADDNICQAESILSSLGYDGIGISNLTDSEEEHAGLGSDIETNIRRLEKTQAKINAALETFRNVQSLQSPGDHKTEDVTNSSFCSLPAVQRSGDISKNPDTAVLDGVKNTDCEEREPKKPGIVRRHSFNNLAVKEKSSSLSAETSHSYKPESILLYDGDIDSSESGNRNSAVFEDTSDTEGNYSPFRSRIRGIFGSFGKGGKKNVCRMHSEESYVNSDKKLITIEYPDSQSSNEKDGNFSIGQFTELVKSLPAHNFSGRESPQSFQSIDGLNESQNSKSTKRPTFLRPKDPEKLSNTKNYLCQNNSSDTHSSVSTTQSFNMSSNRNSVISTQSNSSESYEQDNASVSDNDNADIASHTCPKESRPNNDYLTLSKTQEKKVYYIAKEIMTSERVYVDVLKLINIEFRDYVQKARLESKSGILPDHDFVKLFSNLPELMMLNEDLLRDFEQRISKWDEIKKIADVIIKKGPYLKLYTVYIRDFSAMNFHFDEVCQRYPKFGKLVKEFEKLPRCQHLKLKHFMLKPVQRLPQYKLLLEDYLKHLDSDSDDFDDTTLALKIVSDAAEHANDTVKQGDKFQTMLKLQARLGDWEFIRPGRELLKEGELQKISRKGVGSRYFVLLSDCLLYATYHGSWAGDSTSLKVSYTIPLNQLHVHVPTAEDFQNEFSITSNVRSCTLRARSVQERNDWLDALNSAIEEYRSRKATFITLDHLNPVLRFEGKLGDSAPVWIPDQRVTMCQSCSTEFSLVNRRHHCRACGKVICAPCSASKAPLRYRQFESSRVCDACYEGVEKIYGDDMDLRSRFKRRDISRSVTRFVPQRLKISANSEGSQVSGYLKRKQKNTKWKRCWFVLKDRVLYTYRASEDTVAIDTLPVLGWNISMLDQKDAEPFDSISSYQGFQLTHPGSPTLLFCTENENSTEKWVAALRDAVSFQ